jgi:hypothetical protein
MPGISADRFLPSTPGADISPVIKPVNAKGRCSLSELDAEWSSRMQLDDGFRIDPKTMPGAGRQNHEGAGR